MRSHIVQRGGSVGLVVTGAAWALLLAVASVASYGGNPPIPQPIGRCGQVFHNFPRELHMAWTAVAGANGYNVQVECLSCAVNGQWNNVANLNVTSTTATAGFPGDNKGRWRVRATQTASAPGMSAIQAGPWSNWCEFSFKTPKPAGPCGITLTSLSRTSGHPGDSFKLNGTFGATQGTKDPHINKEGTPPHHLEVLAWTNDAVAVRVPVGLAPGMYLVLVYCESIEGASGTVYSTASLPFEVLGPELPVATVRGRPDIASQKGITIGGAIGGAGGKFVAWGGSVLLSEADALHGSPNRECAFNLSYDMENLQPVPTGPAKFVNRIKVDGAERSKQSMLSLAASEATQINTQAYLPIGRHKLELLLDDDHNITEMPPNGESNNARFIIYSLDGKCYQP